MTYGTQAVTPRTPLAVGASVQVLWNDAWYPALILGLEGPDLRVHYVGWDRSWDAVVPRERVRQLVEWGALRGLPAQGDRLQALWEGHWYDVQVLGVAAEEVRVHYVGWGEEHDELLGAERLRAARRPVLDPPSPRAKALGRPADGPPPPAALVEVNWRGGWYQAVVLEPAGSGVRVRYVGFDDAWDEDVDLARVRVGADLELIEARPDPERP